MRTRCPGPKPWGSVHNQQCLHSLAASSIVVSKRLLMQCLLVGRGSRQQGVATAAASTWALDTASWWQPPVWQSVPEVVSTSNADFQRKCRLLTNRITGAQHPSTVAMLWQERPQHFNRIHLAAALSRLAHMHLAAKAVASQQETQPVPIMHSLVHQLLSAACSKALLRREVSTVLWAIAVLQHPAEPHLVSQLCHLVRQQWAHMQSQDLGMCAWALAKLQRHPGTAWLEQLTMQVQFRMHNMDAQALVNVLWALQTFRHRPSQAWLQAVCQRLTSLLHQLTPQGHANAVWALAGMQHPIPDAWIQHIQQLLSTNTYSFLPAELSMLVFGLARSSSCRAVSLPHGGSGVQRQTQQQVLASAVLQLAEDAAAGWLQQLTCAQAGCLLWGFAHLQHLPGPSFLQAFFQHTQPLLATADASTLANVVLAVQRVQQLQLQQVQQRASTHQRSTTTQAGQAVDTHHASAAWWQAYLLATYALLPQMSTHTCAQCAYSLSLLGVQPPAAWTTRLLSVTHAQLGQQQANPAELMCLAVSLCRWQVSPPATWMLGFMQAFKHVLTAAGSSRHDSCEGACLPHHTSRIVLALAQLHVCLDPDMQQLVAHQFRLQSHWVKPKDVHRLRSAAALVPQLDISWVNAPVQ